MNFYFHREAPAPFVNKINFTTSNTGSTIQVEKQDKVTHAGLLSPSSSKPDGLTDQTKTPGDGSQKNGSPSGIIKVTADQAKFDSVVQVRAIEVLKISSFNDGPVLLFFEHVRWKHKVIAQKTYHIKLLQKGRCLLRINPLPGDKKFSTSMYL